MKSIAALVTELAAAPRPVLCLDTCVFLDIITTGNRGLTDLVEVNRRLSDILVTTPDRMQLVVTSLVLREWGQRRDEVRDEVTKWLAHTDRQILEIHRAWERLGRPLATPRFTYHDPDLVNRLTTLFYCISSMHAGTYFLGITCVFYSFWHLRTAPTSKRRPETAESLEKARFSRECRKNGSFQGLKFPETIRFHKRNSSNDLSLDRGLIQ